MLLRLILDYRMIALKLTNTKNFMNTLLRTECFDHFLLQEATISSGATFVIDGHVPKGYYTDEEIEEFGIAGCSCLPFRMLRGSCFDIIKGKKTPSSFSFVFLLSPDNLEKTLKSLQSSFTANDITALFINVRFQNGELMLTTGISYRTFQLDKSLDKEWDQLVQKFLTQHEVEYDLVS